VKIQDIALNVSYSNEVNTTYKVIELGQDHELIDYQVDMIHNNQVEGLLKVDGRYVNNHLHLYYDVTSKQSLSDYMKRIEWGKNETIDFVENMMQIILRAESYLLDSSSFIIDPSSMYINTKSNDMSLIYLPIKIEQDINQSVKRFLIQWIVYDAVFKKDETETLVTQILNTIKSPHFTIRMMYEELGKIRINQNPQSIPEPELQPVIEVKEPEPEKPSSLENMIKSTPQPIMQQSFNQPKVVATNKKKKQEVTYKTKKKFKKSVLLGFVISQLCIGILFFLFGGKLLEIAGEETTTYAGIALFVVAIEGLIFKRVFSIESMEEVKIVNKMPKQKKLEKQGRQKKEINQKKEQVVQTVAKFKATIQQKTSEQHVFMNKKVIQNQSSQPQIQNTPAAQRVEVSNETTLLTIQPASISNSDETVLLSATTIKPYLTRLSSNGLERIELIKDQFVIGRQHGIVDYAVQESAIGRMHAEFSHENGTYYVKDLNSRNGTFLNEQRLIGEQRQLINTGDIIKMANIDFTFNIDQ